MLNTNLLHFQEKAEKKRKLLAKIAQICQKSLLVVILGSFILLASKCSEAKADDCISITHDTNGGQICKIREETCVYHPSIREGIFCFK